MDRPKKLTWNDVKVGIFALIGLGLMVFMIIVLGTNTLKFTPTYDLNMFVPNVVGLRPGAYITVAGIKAGSVGKFTTMHKEGVRGIGMPLHIKPEYQDKITASSIASIRTLGMLGDKYVEISLGRVDEPPLQTGDWLRAQTPYDLEGAIEDANSTLEKLPVVLDNINGFFDSLQDGSGTLSALLSDTTMFQSLSTSAKNIETLTASFNKRTGTVGKILHDPAVFDNIEQVSSKLDSILEKINDGEGTLGRLIADSTLYVNLNSVTMRTDSLMAALNSTDGTAGKLLNDPEMHDKLVKLLKDVEEIMADMKKRPQKYFRVKVF